MTRFVLLVGPLLMLLHGPVAAAERPPEALVRLSGHVLSALAGAEPLRLDARAHATAAREPVTLTVVLAREDQVGFEHYLHDVYDPESPNHRRFFTPAELADLFGPSRASYDDVLTHLARAGFTLVEGSDNRLTLTVRGTRAQAERAFDVRIADYAIGARRFFANDRDPALPAALAPHVLAISGLTNLAAPGRATAEDLKLVCTIANAAAGGLAAAEIIAGLPILALAPPVGLGAIVLTVLTHLALELFCFTAEDMLHHLNHSAYDLPAGAPDGSGQKIGLLEFDTFRMSDVEDYVALVTRAQGIVGPVGNLSQVNVNGGVATPGPGQTEVLLDVAAAMRIAPGAQVVVYSAPASGQATAYASLFNAMIDDGMTVISNSWSSCEDQVSLADVQGIDAVLQAAAASGISVFNASGDSGSTCLDGAADTVGVPASSPNATAVGGTSLTIAPGFTYGSETWWDGSQATPPTGQGGFGVSRFFTRPPYQDGLNLSSMRSVPDVSAQADPANGAILCEADRGGCPTGLRTAGTSVAAPIWAAFTALLNQAQGQNLGAMNPLLYPLAGTDAFHDAASMGSDFVHVGLGSPNLNVLNRLLAGDPLGPVDGAASRAEPLLLAPPSVVYATIEAGAVSGVGVPADGVAKNGVLVRLVDAAGNIVPGKTVTLTPNGGSAVVTPTSGVTSTDNGSVVFEVTDLVPETVTFTATDTTDGIVLADTPTVRFVVPPAASGNIAFSQSPVTANGIASTTITVTLQDGLGRPTPGKLVRLEQGSGSSVVSGPVPAVTDVNGQIAFTATNLFNETVTYTAVDVADGNLPVPGSAVVQFTNSTNLCGAGTPPPIGENGYQVTPFATAFVARPLNFGGIAFGGCPGSTAPAFLSERTFFSDWTGDVIRLGAAGGAVTTADRLANVGTTLASPIVSKAGKLYYERISSGAGFSGVIVEVDPETGGVVRTLASNLTCPFSLSVDPLSGDLFFVSGCSGSFADPAIRRVRNPDSATPTVEVYATLPQTPNGAIAFAPNGTMYVVTGYFGPTPPVVRVSGTDVPGPPTVTVLPGVTSQFWVNVAEVGPNGDATALLTLTPDGLQLTDITQSPPASTLVARNLGGGVIGPDGCLYAPMPTTVYRVTDASGGCAFAAAGASPALQLAPSGIAPNPQQGTARTFTATLANVDDPEGLLVLFEVQGANRRFAQVRADASGAAALTYVAERAGEDELFASAIVDGTLVTSNPARVTWAAGKHVTFLKFDTSPRGGRPGQPMTVRVSLTDQSVDPVVGVPGQLVEVALGGGRCTATTDAQGVAMCTVPAGAPGATTLSATFAGTSEFTGATETVGFVIEGPAFLGHFTAYTVKPAKGTAKLAKFGPVTLTDGAFGTSGGYDVQKPTLLASPADKNGGGIGDPVTHLDAYAVKLAKGSAKVQARADVQIANQCGALALTAKKPVAVLLPAAQDAAAPVAAPQESDHAVDHLLCYQVKVQKKLTDGTPVTPFPKGMQVDVRDGLDATLRRYDLKKPTLLCNPVAKSGNPIVLSGAQKGTPFPLTPSTVRHPDSHLVCYQAKLATKAIAQNGCGPVSATDKGVKIVPKQAKHVPRLGVHVADQFQATQVDTRKDSLVCVPSSVTLP